MYEGCDFGELLDYHAQRTPEAPALVCGDLRMSYADMRDMTNWYCVKLAQRGLGEGDAVATMMFNAPDFIALFFASLELGLVVVPCDTAIDAAALRDRLSLSNARLLVVHEDCALAADLPAGLSCDVVLVEDGMSRALRESRGNPVIAAYSRARRRVEAAGGRPALIAFTSGSTGRPKGVVHTMEGLFGRSRALASRLDMGPDDRVLVPMPLSHMFGLVCGMLCPLLSGGCVVLMHRHDAALALELVERERATVIEGVPTMYFKELSALGRMAAKPDLSSLRLGIAAGAFVSCVLVERVQNELGVSLVSAYGQTETVNVSSNVASDPLELRQQTVGKLSGGVEGRVVGADGLDVEPGCTGELLVRSSGVMVGYLDLPDETAAVVNAEGWFSTGDLASIGEDGYLRILGRKDDVIIRGGNNVAPAAIECVYLNHPNVADAVVIGYPDELYGERVACFLDRRGCPPPANEMRAYAVDKLPKFSVPDEIVFMDEFPKLSNGKVDRARMKRDFLKAKGLDAGKGRSAGTVEGGIGA